MRGNGQIIQELESLFIGAGWNVIKVLWGSEWDGLFARDRDLVLRRRFAETVDGQYQDLGSKDGDYNRVKFFDTDPATRALVAHMTDAEIHALKRGGHDFRKLHAAFAAAKAHKGRPTVILAKTKKGYGMGNAGESRMTAHQSKKLDMAALVAFRDRFKLPLSEADLEGLKFYRPAEDSPEMTYLRARRTALGGALPQRLRGKAEADRIAVPALDSYAGFALAAEGKEMSTTMAAVRMMGGLLKDKALGPRIVPIVADEARTFGMDSGEYDNTVFVFMSDNGADGQDAKETSPDNADWIAEKFDNATDNIGTVTSFAGYGPVWGAVGSTPLRRYKRFPYESGIRVPAFITAPGTVEPTPSATDPMPGPNRQNRKAEGDFRDKKRANATHPVNAHDHRNRPTRCARCSLPRRAIAQPAPTATGRRSKLDARTAEGRSGHR